MANKSDTRTKQGKFKKGTSGNPSGRPIGSRNRATLLAEQLLEGFRRPAGVCDSFNSLGGLDAENSFDNLGASIARVGIGSDGCWALAAGLLDEDPADAQSTRPGRSSTADG